jgi:hypothetical protein
MQPLSTQYTTRCLFLYMYFTYTRKREYQICHPYKETETIIYYSLVDLLMLFMLPIVMYCWRNGTPNVQYTVGVEERAGIIETLS